MSCVTELFCFVSGVSGTTTVTCTSSNPLQFPQQCSLDILEEPFDCKSRACAQKIYVYNELERAPYTLIFYTHEIIAALVYAPLGNATSVELSIEEYPPGDYNFTVTVTDVFNQSVTVDILLSISGMQDKFSTFSLSITQIFLLLEPLLF